MPLDGGAQWQIDILAADKTAQAFAAVEQRLAGLQSSQARMAAAMGTASSAATALVGRLGPLAAVYLTVEAARGLFETALKSGELGHEAEQIGVSTDQLQAYRLMAAQSGVSTEQLDATLMHYAKSAGQANAGNDEMIARFDKLGVKLLDANKQLRPTSDTLPELARGLLNVASSSERSALEIDFFGKSGARIQTMLEGWAAGNDKVVASARQQNALVSPETIKAWEELGDHLEASNVRYKAMVAEFGKPVALAGLQALNFALATTVATIGSLQAAWKSVQGVFETTSEDLIKRGETLQATVDVIKDSADPLDQAKLVGIRQELQRINDVLASRAKVFTVPEVTVTVGALQPTGKAAGAEAEKLDERLKALQAEHKSLDAALSAFQLQGTESVDELNRRLEAQVAQTKKVSEALKGVPADSPLRAQLTAEATAVVQGNLALAERKRILTEAESTTAKYGDGTAVAAREIDQLNKMLALGAIDQGTYDRAVKATTLAQEDQSRAARGAGTGFDALVAGIEQGAADLAKANTAFEIGGQGFQQTMNLMDQAINDLVTNGQIDFNKLLQSFLLMILQMEVRAAASSVWKSLGGFSGVVDFLRGGNPNAGGFATVGSGAGSTSGVPNFTGSAKGNIFDMPGLVPFARGGIVDRPTLFPFANGTGLMGEAGPEAIVPLSRGPGGRLGIDASGVGGGGGDVYVSIVNNTDSKVTARKSKGPGGAPKVDILVEQLESAMAGRVSRGQGALDKVMQGRFGLAPVGAR